MRLCLLHLDDALKLQQSFMRACGRGEVRHIEAETLGAEVRLWGKQAQLDRLHTVLGENLATAGDDPLLCFMGSGDFHHVTALLLLLALEKHSGPATVIHLDNHPDWVKFNGGMHCGSWVNRAAEYPQIVKIITIGVCSSDLRGPDRKRANLKLLSQGILELFPYGHAPSRVRGKYGTGASYQQHGRYIQWRTIEELGERAFIEMLLARINTKNVYITVDKDVLARQDAETNWDQGVMRLPFLLQVLSEVGEHHAIIGADISGDYSTPRYSGSAWTRIRKRAEIFMDQPPTPPDIASASALNSATNHALMEVLTEAMA